MVKFSISLILVLSVGCASRTQVHIFSRGVEDNKIIQLSNLLEEKGFDARPNLLPVPANFFRHTVIFPAIVQDFAMVELIESAMDEAGYPRANLVLEQQSNHSYSTDNIGIYLVNPDFEGSYASLVGDPYSLGDGEAAPFTYNYFSECPKGSEAQSELNLYPSGVAILEQFIWDEADNQERNIVYDGEWASNPPLVEIDFFDEGILNLSIKEHTGSNHFGPFEALTLVAQDSTMKIERCDYTYLDYLE